MAEKLEHIKISAVATIVAPMGYGKTKAVDWWIRQHEEEEGILCIRQVITTDSLHDFWYGLCRNLKADGKLYDELCALGFPMEARAGETASGFAVQKHHIFQTDGF